MAAILGLARTTTLSTDSDSDGLADAGDVLHHTLTITNTGDASALGTIVTDTLGGSTLTGVVNVSPVAFNDSFTAVGNTVLRVDGAANIGSGPSSQVAGNLLSNDSDAAGDGVTGFQLDTVTGGTSAQGGTFNIFSDGSFNYVNEAGDTGTDSFTYTIRDAGLDGTYNTADDLTSTATVTITLTGEVWYVDSAAAPGGDGTSVNPFSSITALNTANLDGAGDTIYVAGNAAGAIVLESGQQLIGTGAALSVGGFALASAGANSDITGSSGFTVTLAGGGAGNNTIAGIDINGVGGITGTSFGTLTVNNATIDTSGQAISLSTGTIAGTGLTSTNSDGGTSNLSFTSVDGTLALGSGALANATAGANVAVSGGNLGLTYNGTVSQSQASATVSVSGGHTGTLDFNGNVSATNGSGLQFNNADGTYRFDGGANSLNGGDAGIDITNGSTGTFVFDNLTLTHGGGGDAFVLQGSNANVTLNGTVTDNVGGALNIDDHDGGTMTINAAINSSGASAQGIQITDSAGTINFNGAIQLSTQGNAAINMTNNVGGTYNFAPGGAGLDIVTTTGGGFRIDGGGTVTLAGSGNTIATTSGRAVEIDNATIGGAGFTLLSVGVSNGSSTTGVFLNNAGSGGFTVTGTGSTAGSGGAINSIEIGADGNVEQGTGIYIANTNNISLSNMSFAGDFANFGIRGVNVNNFTLRDSVTVASGDNGNFGTSNAADEGVISFDNLSGTALFEGNNLAGGHEDIVVIDNSTGTLNVTFQDSANDAAVIGFNGSTVGSATGNDGILINTYGTSNTTVLINGVTFNGSRGDMIQTNASEGATQNITISNNTMHNLHPDITSGGGGITVGGGAGTGSGVNITYAITGNSLRGAEGTAIVASLIGPVGTMSGTILNNTIGNNNAVHNSLQADTGSSAGGNGIFVRVEKGVGAGTLSQAVRIEGNNIGDVVFGAGIYLLSNGAADGSGTARLEATIRNNTIDEMGVNSLGGIYAQLGGAGTDDGLLGLNIEGNTINLTGATNSIAGIVFDDLAPDAQLYFPGYGGPYTDAGLEAFHDGPEGNNFTVAGTFATPVLTSPTGTFASGAAFVLPVPIMAAGAVVFDWEAAIRAAQSQAYQDYLASLESQDGEADGSGGEQPAPPEPDLADDGILSADELALIVDAAIARWEAAGATPDQLAAMRAVEVSVSDLGGLMLGSSAAGTIAVDDDAAGWRWFVDATPGDDAEFTGDGSVLNAVDPLGDAGTRMDLLTVIMHELGHQIGLEDIYAAGEADELMYGTITAGERRLPGADDLEAATGVAVEGAFALAPVNVGTIPVGQTVTLDWYSIVDAYANGLVPTYTNNSTATEDNGAGTATDSNSETLGTGASNIVLDSLTLGDLIFEDVNLNGVFDAGDAGIDGVALSLFADADNDDVPDGAAIATTTSASGGLYSFAGLAPGNYIVRVDASNFLSGSALEGMATTTGAADPDDDADNDDNGADDGAGGVIAGSLTLSDDGEPDGVPGGAGDEDGDADADTNLTLDFGFVDINQEEDITGLQGDDVGFTEGDTAVLLDAGGDAAITEVDSPDYAGGSLTVSITSNLAAGEDQLGIDTSGTVTVTGGNELRVGGTQIATVSGGGAGGGDLVFSFNASATAATVGTLLRALTYFNSNIADPDASQRTVSYTLVDGDGTTLGGDDTTVRTSTVTITAVDDAAVAEDDAFATNEATVLNGAASVFANNGSGADTDPEGDAFAVTEVNGLAGNVGMQFMLASGALVTLNANGTFAYDPNGAFDALANGASDTDSFTYTVTGGDTATVTVTINGLPGPNYDGDAGNNMINGDSRNNTINGFGGNDWLKGLGGADVLNGGQGNDGLSAGGGHDTANGGAGDDLLYGNGGNDILNGNGGNDTIWAGIGADVVSGGNDDDLLFGHSGADQLGGDGGNDTIWGGADNDTIDGGIGDDTLFGQIGDDTISGSGGDDYINGGAGGDTIYGNDGADTLYGSLGNDVLDGGVGSDSLNGGAGDDTLTGGAGADRFVFIDGWGDDVITDFANDGLEKIVLTPVAGATGLGALTLTDQGADVLIEYGGNSILVQGLQAADLDSSDFLFAL